MFRKGTFLVCLFAAGTIAPALNATIIYDSIPSPMPYNVTSQSFQAQRISEMGDLIKFVDEAAMLTSVTALLSDQGTASQYGSADPGFNQDMTLNLYNVDNSGANPAPGSLITSVTQNFFIPWRPEADPSCTGGYWKAPNGTCYSGLATTVTFNLSGMNVWVPNQIIYSLSFNTQSAGYPPLGAPGPYNSLNMGLDKVNGVLGTPSVGSNPNFPLAYLSGTLPSSYGDNGAGGINVFRLDTGGTHTLGAMEFDATPEPGTALLTIGAGLLAVAGAIRRRMR